MIITLKFTKRDRYCKAMRHMMKNDNKYRILCCGRYLPTTRDDGWYIEFENITF